ncbi:NupC/NupG family nucleoside CNT transporter [Tenacibaculum piscium]|uniref:Na+ dependent nucleoside transporter n=1 Tax=Tenacibaculum piscium TaxID=1458515 RepID=A0A2H1YJ28_9FLAO|nr:nucleoside transporter C-terminal domain-containing protein [Tenacibaculum piscium]MBE7628720.1 Na+ dependent nucleoside transporter [Tenacibaculum piscium]MBE7669861.1 Na+ dependent nucleoside transporter [Tenacibaculum piscium]MBE7689164.1 Na+ dependent nucleoside transporter [Tenacibaculum piscium]SOS75509.1 Na+ dependent nucleoside transporter [Tenacibaculum piscium]
MKRLFTLLMLCASVLTFGQSIEKNWNFSSITTIKGTSLASPADTKDVLNLSKGEFNYLIINKDNLQASGNYIHQNNLLIFKYKEPKDTVRYYNIIQLTDSVLTISEQNILYNFTSNPQETSQETLQEIIAEVAVLKVSEDNQGNQDNETDTINTAKIKPSQGFSMQSLWRGLLGMISLVLIAFLFSANRKGIDWKIVGLGLAFQLIIAIGVLKVPFVQAIFEFIGKGFVSILGFTQAGSEFLFQGLISDMDTFGFIFAFQILPTIIFFSALTSLLFYLGVIQKVVKALAWSLSKVLKISGAESLSVAGNIFLGQTEAPLLIKAYLEKMNKSEMLLVMIGGMATVAGAVLAAYIGFLGGDDETLKLFYAKHLLAASVMAAPGAIVISKILYPQTEEIVTDIKVSQDKIGSNILDAIANGTTEGLQLAMNVGAMLLVFVAFIALINGVLGGLGDFNGISYLGWEFTSLNTIIEKSTAYTALSLEFILGYIFAPLMWLIGVAREDMALMGQLLGIKLAASEFVGYIQLSELKDVANTTHLTYNKSIIMATYMLCGFANFASIGIQIGGIGSLAPGQRKTLSEFGMKALIGGTVASLMSATIAGMIIG